MLLKEKPNKKEQILTKSESLTLNYNPLHYVIAWQNNINKEIYIDLLID